MSSFPVLWFPSSTDWEHMHIQCRLFAWGPMPVSCYKIMMIICLTNFGPPRPALGHYQMNGADNIYLYSWWYNISVKNIDRIILKSVYYQLIKKNIYIILCMFFYRYDEYPLDVFIKCNEIIRFVHKLVWKSSQNIEGASTFSNFLQAQTLTWFTLSGFLWSHFISHQQALAHTFWS